MNYFSVSNAVVAILIISIGLDSGLANPNRGIMRPFQQQMAARKVAPVMCTHDTLMIYQDCRMCVCPRPNRVAKCFKKSCDLRTKDGGQCPAALLKMDDSKLCALAQMPGCKIDADCPGPLLCCFDFCSGSKCVEPVPLDVTSGVPAHNGRGFQ